MSGPQIHPKLPRYIFIFFLKYLMLQTHSPHRPEGPSSPLPRCTTFTKVVTDAALQLHFVPCSYTLYLALPLQRQSKSKLVAELALTVLVAVNEAATSFKLRCKSEVACKSHLGCRSGLPRAGFKLAFKSEGACKSQLAFMKVPAISR